MKKVLVSNLKGGEILAKDICTSHMNILMAKGTVLKKEYIERLPLLNIYHVYVEEQNQLDEIEQKIEMKKEQSILGNNRIDKNLLQECKNKVKAVLERHIYKQNQELVDLCDMAEELIANIFQEPELHQTVIEIREGKKDMYTHSVQVCGLATLLAFRLGLKKEIVSDIARGAILHDIGLRYITVSYENCDLDKLSKQEIKEYKTHTLYGYQSLKQEKWLSEQVKEIVLMHHEYEDGTGYPVGLSKKQIPIYVKIITVCDIFDEMVSGIGYKHGKVQEAIEFLKYNSGILFDRKITEIFLNMIVHYPIGAIVKLSTGETAKVIRQNSKFSDRPVLEIQFNEKGQPVQEKKIIDLCKVLSVFVIQEENN